MAAVVVLIQDIARVRGGRREANTARQRRNSERAHALVDATGATILTLFYLLYLILRGSVGSFVRWKCPPPRHPRAMSTVRGAPSIPAHKPGFQEHHPRARR